MTIRRLFTVIYTIIIVAMIALAALVLVLQNVLTRVEESQANRYQSYLLADELRQSSDDLTHYVRTYTLTGDPKWEQIYWDVLAIRNGEKPRPENYGGIYWDFVASSGQKPRPDSEAVPLRTLMTEAGFTEDELAKLDEAQSKSDALVQLETEAMNLVKGLYPDASGNYTIQGEPDLAKAHAMVFSQKYYDEKAKIMQPLDDFFTMIDQRTLATVEMYQSQADVIVWMIVAIVVLLIGLSVFSLMMVLRRISAPLEQAVKVIQQVVEEDLKKMVVEIKALATGDLTRKLEFQKRSLTTQNQDEVGMILSGFNDMTSGLANIAGAFEEMAANLRVQVGQVAQSAAGLSSASAQLATTANQAGDASNQIAITIQQVAQSTTQQAESIGRTSSSVEQMGRAIHGVAQGAQEQNKAVSKASDVTSQLSGMIQQITTNAQAGVKGSQRATAVAEDGTQIVANTLQGMDRIKDKVSLSAQRVQEMGARSKQIGIILDTIEDIASQTNLLALNAAIEAARAGEHGRGFAIVAEEVRKLAERAGSSTKEIATLVSDIQQTVNEAVAAMSEGSAEVGRGVEQAKNAGKALAEIVSAGREVNQQVTEIAGFAERMNRMSSEMVAAVDTVSAVIQENTASTEAMASSSNAVTQAIENIASISEENSAAIEEVSASTEEMTAQAEEVSASAQELAEMAEVLLQVVAKFKLQEATGRQPQAASGPVRPGAGRQPSRAYQPVLN